LESTRTVFPQLFSNVMCDVIDLMNVGFLSFSVTGLKS